VSQIKSVFYLKFFFLIRLRTENERLKSDNASIRSDLTQTKQLKDEIILKNNQLITQLQNELENKTKHISKLEEQLRGDLSTQDLSITRVKQLEEELNNERQQRHKLIIEMNRLEHKCENLESELQNGNIHKPKLAPSDSNMTWDSKFMDTFDLLDLPVNISILFQLDTFRLTIRIYIHSRFLRNCQYIVDIVVCRKFFRLETCEP
jgi:hypothetical protein